MFQLFGVLIVANAGLLILSDRQVKLECSKKGIRGTNNHQHDVCIEEKTVKKRLKSHRRHDFNPMYTENQLANVYYDCSPALVTPLLVKDGIAFYPRVDDHEATPMFEENREWLERLDKCAQAHGDCFSDLKADNIHLTASGHIAIIDVNIRPCSMFREGAGPSLPGMSNLFGSYMEQYYII